MLIGVGETPCFFFFDFRGFFRALYAIKCPIHQLLCIIEPSLYHLEQTELPPRYRRGEKDAVTHSELHRRRRSFNSLSSLSLSFPSLYLVRRCGQARQSFDGLHLEAGHQVGRAAGRGQVVVVDREAHVRAGMPAPSADASDAATGGEEARPLRGRETRNELRHKHAAPVVGVAVLVEVERPRGGERSSGGSVVHVFECFFSFAEKK